MPLLSLNITSISIPMLKQDRCPQILRTRNYNRHWIILKWVNRLPTHPHIITVSQKTKIRTWLLWNLLHRKNQEECFSILPKLLSWKANSRCKGNFEIRKCFYYLDMYLKKDNVFSNLTHFLAAVWHFYYCFCFD